MSREQTADKAALSLDMYMRAKCDIFLKRLESQMFAQVTHMIKKVRSEIYSEVDKIADNFLRQCIHFGAIPRLRHWLCAHMRRQPTPRSWLT